jgi:hypothetical protein
MSEQEAEKVAEEEKKPSSQENVETFKEEKQERRISQELQKKQIEEDFIKSREQEQYLDLKKHKSWIFEREKALILQKNCLTKLVGRVATGMETSKTLLDFFIHR